MSDTKSYIFQFNENNQQFTLTGVEGEELIIDSNHKKYDWLHNLDPNKIVKINASGRWNSSKDYQGIREMILSPSNNPSINDQAEPQVHLIQRKK